MRSTHLLLVLFLTSLTLVACGNKPKKGSCIDVTSYDYNRDNDMKCTRSDGSVFYTDYAGAREFESR